MSVRARSVAVVVVTVSALIVLLLVASQIILLNSYSQLELQETEQFLQRAINAVEHEVAALVTTSEDWAYWDDTYHYLQTQDPQYEEVNLFDETLVTLRLNLMVFANREREVIFGRGYDTETETRTSLPPQLDAYLAEDGLLPTSDGEPAGVAGLLHLSTDLPPLMLSARPVLTSLREGPATGWLVMGRFLTPEEVARLGEVTQQNLTIAAWDAPDMAPDMQAAVAHLSTSSFYSQPMDGEIAGYAVLRDFRDQPAAILRVSLPRTIYSQGQTSVSYLTLSLLLTGLAAALAIYLALDRFVLRRLGQLNTEVERVGTNPDRSDRVHIQGNDEISHLSSAINAMLTAIEDGQTKLQSRQAQLDTILYSANFILFSTDETGNITLALGKGLQALDFTAEQVLNRSLKEFLPDLGEVLDETLKRVMAGNPIWLDTSPTVPTFEIYLAPLRGPDGRSMGTIGVATDITSRKATESELELRNRQLMRLTLFFQSTLEHLVSLAERGTNGKDMLEVLNNASALYDSMFETDSPAIPQDQ